MEIILVFRIKLLAAFTRAATVKCVEHQKSKCKPMQRKNQTKQSILICVAV